MATHHSPTTYTQENLFEQAIGGPIAELWQSRQEGFVKGTEKRRSTGANSPTLNTKKRCWLLMDESSLPGNTKNCFMISTAKVTTFTHLTTVGKDYPTGY